MNSFYMAFSVVCPLFLMMSLGYLLRKLGIFNERFLNELNNLCFKVFLPILLFINVYQSNTAEVFQLNLVVFAIASVVGSYVMVFLVVPFLERKNKKRGVLIQGIFRSNFILFGITVTISLYGNAYVGITAVLISCFLFHEYLSGLFIRYSNLLIYLFMAITAVVFLFQCIEICRKYKKQIGVLNLS